MKTVTLKMNDLLNGGQVERTIDASNAYSNGSVAWELRCVSEQRKKLENWILERGNEQHDTILELVSWIFNVSIYAY